MTEASHQSTVEVEGEVAGDGVDELFRAWIASEGYVAGGVTVDLGGVIHIDHRGRRLLCDMQERGVRFTGARLAVADVLKELRSATNRRAIL